MVVVGWKLKSPWMWLDFIAKLSVGMYSVMLVYLMFRFSREDLLESLHSFGVGYPLPEKDYGDVCQVYTPQHPSGNKFFNVTDRIDVFVLAHALGWFVKALIVRDVWISWICSILFELIELAFAHLLPNFNECWWDSILLDVLGCNLLGIYAAEIFMQAMKFRKYNFTVKCRTIFSTRNVYNYLFSSLLLILLITLIDLNIFFIKYILFIPTTHWLCLLRTFMWVLISAPASRELYVNAGRKSRKRFFSSCTTCMVGIVGLACEILVCVVFRGNLFIHSAPTPISTVMLIVSLVYATIWALMKVYSTEM